MILFIGGPVDWAAIWGEKAREELTTHLCQLIAPITMELRSNLDLPPSAAAEGNGGGYKDQDRHGSRHR